LQRDPSSPFVQNAVVQRWKGAAHWSMRGRVLRVLTQAREEKSLIASAEDYVGTLRTVFGLDLPQAASLWPKICARHEEIFADRDPLHEAPAMSVDDVRGAFGRLE
jgi:N-hydroxyarylamine O-acetyltransferase